VLVHGVGGASGNFTLFIATRSAILFDLFVEYKVSIQALQDLSSPQYSALAWMVNIDSTDLQFTLSDDEVVERLRSSSSTVAWKAVSGIEYLLLITSTVLLPGSSIREFELQIVDNDSCDAAFGPITTAGLDSFLLGSTSDGTTIDTTLLSNVDVVRNGISGSIPTELGTLYHSNTFIF
jgi:hypothetical protein